MRTEDLSPLNYFEDALNSDFSIQAVEIEATLTANKSKEWSFDWDIKVFQDDEHPDFDPIGDRESLTSAAAVYLEDLSRSFVAKTEAKVTISLERVRPQQDIWRCDYKIHTDSILSRFIKWLRALFT